MSSPQLFLVQEDEKDTRFKTSLKELPHLPDGLEEITPKDAPEFQAEDIDIYTAPDKKEDLQKCSDEKSISSTESRKPSLGQSEVADEDDGFVTPTSSDHRIPFIRQCPLAPKKIKPSPSRKRKASPRIRQNLQLDLSRQVDLMFPPMVRDDLGRMIKKARTDDST